jgi:hypothetical protein
MKSRKWIGTVLITLVVVTVLAAGGYALYRYGFARGRLAASSVDGFMFQHFDDMPFPGGHMDDFPGGRFGAPGFDGMPEHFRDRFEGSGQPGHHFDRGIAPRSVPYSGSLITRSYFSPFTFVLKLLFIGFVIWLLYKFVSLFTGGKSWQLSFNSVDAEEPEVELKPKSRAKKS